MFIPCLVAMTEEKLFYFSHDLSECKLGLAEFFAEKTSSSSRETGVVRTSYDAVIRFLKEGKFHEAESVLKELLYKEGDDRMLILGLAHVTLWQGKVQDASSWAFQFILNMREINSPSKIRAYDIYLDSQIQLENYTHCLFVLDKLIGSASDVGTRAHFKGVRSVVRLKLYDYENMFADAEEYCSGFPGDIQYRKFFVKIKQRFVDGEKKSQEEIRKLLNSDNVSVSILFDAATVELFRDKKLAVDLLDKVLEMDNDNLEALKLRSRMFSEDQGKYDMALLDADRIMKIDENSPLGYYIKGHCLVALGRLEESRYFFKSSLEKNKYNVESLWHMCAISLIKTNLEEALLCQNRIILLESNHIPHLVNRAEIYMTMGDLEHAKFDLAAAEILLSTKDVRQKEKQLLERTQKRFKHLENTIKTFKK
jgi:tetratricopeptide (TPR) repeat protein